jgi:hypothetical protein
LSTEARGSEMAYNFGRADYNEEFGGTDDLDAEPVFLLRGKDPASARAVRFWVSMASDYGVNTELLISANDVARRMEAYALEAGRKPADAPQGALPGV